MNLFKISPLEQGITPEGIHYKIPERETEEIISQFAFPREIAVQIKEDNQWKCSCGRGMNRADGGYLVDASHLDHDKRNPYYAHPSNGLCECLLCHTQRHIDLLKEADDDSYDWAFYSVQSIARRIWDRGLHSKSYRFSKNIDIDDDRVELVELCNNNDIDLFELLDIE